jgi:hypothetical protein
MRFISSPSRASKLKDTRNPSLYRLRIATFGTRDERSVVIHMCLLHTVIDGGMGSAGRITSVLEFRYSNPTFLSDTLYHRL